METQGDQAGTCGPNRSAEETCASRLCCGCSITALRDRSNRLVTYILEVGLLRPEMPIVMTDRSKDMGRGNRKTTQ